MHPTEQAPLAGPTLRLSQRVPQRPWAVRVHLLGGLTMQLGVGACCRLAWWRGYFGHLCAACSLHGEGCSKLRRYVCSTAQMTSCLLCRLFFATRTSVCTSAQAWPLRLAETGAQASRQAQLRLRGLQSGAVRRHRLQQGLPLHQHQGSVHQVRRWVDGRVFVSARTRARSSTAEAFQPAGQQDHVRPLPQQVPARPVLFRSTSPT